MLPQGLPTTSYLAKLLFSGVRQLVIRLTDLLGFLRGQAGEAFHLPDDLQGLQLCGVEASCDVAPLLNLIHHNAVACNLFLTAQYVEVYVSVLLMEAHTSGLQQLQGCHLSEHGPVPSLFLRHAVPHGRVLGAQGGNVVTGEGAVPPIPQSAHLLQLLLSCRIQAGCHGGYQVLPLCLLLPLDQAPALGLLRQWPCKLQLLAPLHKGGQQRLSLLPLHFEDCHAKVRLCFLQYDSVHAVLVT
mmetsp:Transcript_46583/g.83331  ORF Transcript_46583/g.83331 Transcript_46583/m.83331 type:complete len:242 (+) Transcript_46583:559-1284(+)